MHKLINKKNILKITFTGLLIISLILNLHSKIFYKPVNSKPLNRLVILIDPGHGYPDGGAVGKSGIMEKDINFSLAKKLGEYFLCTGASVYYTRMDDNSVALSDGKKFSENLKSNDLRLRKEMADTYNADIFISIHMNNFQDSRYRGAQVFYDGFESESSILANYIQNSLIEIADKNNNRKEKNSSSNIFILKNAKIPSVLIECGFLSNEVEEAKLQTEEYQNVLAFSIYSGVMKYLSK